MRNRFIVTNCDKGMKFRVMEIIDGKAIGNGLRFDTRATARRYAKNFPSKRPGVSGYLIEQTTDVPLPSISSEELIRRVVEGKKRA